MLPKWHRKAVLCAGHHFSDTFDSISKKTLRLAHFLLGTGPILHAFLLQACSSTQHTRSHLLHVDCLYPVSSGTAGTNASVVADLAKRKHCGHPRTHRTAQELITFALPCQFILEYVGGHLVTNLMFGEITTLLQLCVEISSSILRPFSNRPMFTRPKYLILTTNCDV